MNSLTFLFITLTSGAIAGTLLGLINLIAVEPLLDKAIDIEIQNAIRSGEQIDPEEFANYRLWQKGGQVMSGTILGLAFGALFGLIYAYGREILPGSTNLKKAVVLAGIMWIVVFIMPAIKYPANPPTVGDPETIGYRQSLYVSFIFISGLSALGLSILYKKLNINNLHKTITIYIIYGAIMTIAFITMPKNPDEITAPMDLVQSFRIASIVTMTAFWIILGIVFGKITDIINPFRKTEFSSI